MKKLLKEGFGSLLGILAIVFLTQPVQAIPAFAKKHNLSCTDCHSTFPKLNAFGRNFKARGYRLEEELEGEIQRNQEISKDLVLEKSFPFSALIKGYAFDKKKNKDAKTRGLHELELMI